MKLRSKFREIKKTPGSSGEAGFRESAFTKKGRGLGFLIGLPFFVAGAFFCWLGAIKPILGVAESSSWPEVPCRIVSSEVKTSRGSDSDTYRVDITFAYTFEGREFTGGSFDFSDMSSSGRSAKAEVVRRYPVGYETTCWVNPRDPTIAVLSRSIPKVVYLIIPFTSIFMLIGGGIILGSLGLLPAKWSRNTPKHNRVAQADQLEVNLKPSAGPRAKLVGTVFFAAFWNGIVGVFLWGVIDGFRKGDPEWFPVFFLIPFVVVGIGSLGAIVYFSLALLNPKIRLKLDEGSPRLGDTVRLSWDLSGSIHRLEDLVISLEGREAATFRRGTRSVTDQSLFWREIIFQTDEPLAHRTGQVSFSIPADQMHSFLGRNNTISWSLHVRGSISRWPDVADRYPITVRPMGSTLQGASSNQNNEYKTLH